MRVAGIVGVALALAGAGVAGAAPGPVPGVPISPAFDARVAAIKAAMMADPGDALRRAKAAEAAAPSVEADRRPLALATARWLEGEALFRLNQPDRALAILQNALALASQAAPGGKLEADVTLARGQTEVAVGEVTRSFADLQRAFLLYSRLGDARGEAKALQEIGGLYSDAGDDARSLRYYAEVTEIYRGDPAIDLAVHNNIGEALKRLHRYGPAEAQYRLALAAARTLDSPILQVRILSNLASAQLLDGRTGAAQETAATALRLAGSGEAAEWRPFIYGVLGQIAFASGDLPAAKSLLDRAFAGVDLAQSPAPFRDFHATAVDVYQRSGQPELALRHLQALKRLDDDANRLVASSSAALANARFDFARQDLRIATLKADHARQAAAFDASRARSRATIFGVLLAAGGVIVVLLLGAFLSLRRSRNEVRAANANLRGANGSLERALKVKSEFLATTSHEIRTPLNGILGMTQVLLADRRLEPAVRERVGIVHSAGETMRALVDDLLDVSKMESGKLEIAREEVSLKPLLADAARLWRDQAAAKGLRLETILDGCPAAIVGDGPRLRQIVSNLLSNAFKFTEHGEVRLRAWAEGEGAAETLLVSVEDSGIGIPADKLELIFESFRQADGGVTRRFGGTGLGLTICRSLAQAMGGDVTVASRVGEGSTFTLRLPLERADTGTADADEAPQAGRAQTLGQAHLLIVDGNQLSRRVLVKILKGQVNEITEASGVGEAQDAVARSSVDMILVDSSCLPSDDEHALSGLRAAAGHPALCLLLGKDAAVPQGAGACPLIRKPVSATDLVQALASLVAAPNVSAEPLPQATAA